MLCLNHAASLRNYDVTLGVDFIPHKILEYLMYTKYVIVSQKAIRKEDDKYSIGNTYVQELFHVWYDKSKISPKNPITKISKIPKLLSMISLRLGRMFWENTQDIIIQIILFLRFIIMIKRVAQGNCLKPPHERGNPDAYRVEIVLIISGLMGLLSICLIHGTNKKTIVVGCDEESYLKI